MTFILIIATIMMNLFGVAHEAVTKINHILGTDLSGFLMFIFAWIIALIIDSIARGR